SRRSSDLFMAKESMVDGDEETIIKFIRAIYKAQKWVQEISAADIAKTIQPYFEDTEIDILTSSIQRYKEQITFATDPVFEEKEWNNLEDIMDEDRKSVV